MVFSEANKRTIFPPLSLALEQSCLNGNTNHKYMTLQSRANQFSISVSTEGLGSLDWSTNGSVNDQLWEDTKSSRYTEEHRVVTSLSQAVIL